MHAASAHAYPSRDQTSSKTHEARGECSMQDKARPQAQPIRWNWYDEAIARETWDGIFKKSDGRKG